MKCLICGFENLEGSKFCCQCSSPLNIDAANVGQLVRAIVRQEIDAQRKDGSLVELDVTEKVTKRLLEWTKIVGTIFAAALAVLVAGLAFFGISSKNDLQQKVTEAESSINRTENDITTKSKTLQSDVDATRKQIVDLRSDYELLKSDEAAVRKFTSSIEELSHRIWQSIENVDIDLNTDTLDSLFSNLVYLSLTQPVPLGPGDNPYHLSLKDVLGSENE